MGALFCSLCKLYFSVSSGWCRLMGLYCLMNFSLFIAELNLTQNFPVFFFWLGNLSQMYRVICLNVIVFDLAANYSSISSWPQSESTRSWRTFRKTHPHPAVLVLLLMICSTGKRLLWVQQTAHLLEVFFLYPFTSHLITLSSHPRLLSGQKSTIRTLIAMAVSALTSSKSSGALPWPFPRYFSPYAHCWQIQTPMILWCLRLLTCTRLIEWSMRQLLDPGLRSMPWARGFSSAWGGDLLCLNVILIVNKNRYKKWNWV